MYKILTGNQVIYESSNKSDCLVVNPVLKMEIGEAGDLEFTILPGHALHDQMHEMQTFVSAYQDDEQIFYGRVLRASEDILGQLHVTCEGALTFLLDSELGPVDTNETVASFFRRCINSHNSQVEANKQFVIGNISHSDANKSFAFKIKDYPNIRKALDSYLTNKYGGFLFVRYVNGNRYIDLIQEPTNVNSQPIEIGYNIIDKEKRISGEDIFSILRPLGKDNLTIDGVSEKNLLDNAQYDSGKSLDKYRVEVKNNNNNYVHSQDKFRVDPGKTYTYGPGEAEISYYDKDGKCISSEKLGKEYTVTVPTSVDGSPSGIKYAKLSYRKEYDSKITFKEVGTNVLSKQGAVAGSTLSYTKFSENGTPATSSSARGTRLRAVSASNYETIKVDHESVEQAPGWSYSEEYVQVVPGEQYIAVPGSIVATFYNSNKECIDIYKSQDGLGCDIFTIPEGASYMRLSYPSRYADQMRVEKYNNDNLASRSSGVDGALSTGDGETEKTDGTKSYSRNYIPVEEDTYYVSGPGPISLNYYDENKKYISTQNGISSKSGEYLLRAPAEAKYARATISSANEGSQVIQQGKSLVHLSTSVQGTTIVLEDRLQRYGRIIHTEKFGDISDPNDLYNAAMEWLRFNHTDLPSSMTIGIVDFHLLNPSIQKFAIGDTFTNIVGFENERVTIGSLTKDMEDPSNDQITLKNRSELNKSQTGHSASSISAKYAKSESVKNGTSSGGGAYYGGSSIKTFKHIRDEDDDSFFGVAGVREIGLEALELLHIEAPRLRLLANSTEDIEARIDIVAKGLDDEESRIAMTANTTSINSQNIVIQAKNTYNIADNMVTIADTVYTHANLIWNEAKDIVTIAENLYTVADNVYTFADNYMVQANVIDMIAGDVEIVDDTIKKIFGSAIHATADQLVAGYGVMEIDAEGVIHIKDGSGIKFDLDDTSYGLFTDDQLDIGTFFKRVLQENGDSFEAKFGTYVVNENESLLDAGVIVDKITDENLGDQYKVALGTYVNGAIDGGIVIEKITSPTVGDRYKATFGTYINDQIEGGVIVNKITNPTLGEAYKVAMGTYINDQLDGGVIVNRITNPNLGQTYQVAMGTYIKGKLDAGFLVDKINGSSTATIRADHIIMQSGSQQGNDLDVTINGNISAINAAVEKITANEAFIQNLQSTTGNINAIYAYGIHATVNGDGVGGVITAPTVNASNELKASNILRIGNSTGTQGGETGRLYYQGDEYTAVPVRWKSDSAQAFGRFLVNSAFNPITLNHYHNFEVSEGTGTNAGKVTIEMGDVSTTAVSKTFNMASTTWYAGRVEAYKNAVSTALGDAGFSGNKHTLISMTPDLANGVIRINSAVSKIQYPDSTAAESVSISLPSTYDISSQLTAYKKTIGLKGPTWNDISGAYPTSRNFTVSVDTDNGKSVTNYLFLSQDGWNNNKLTVSLKVNNVNSANNAGIIAQTVVDGSSLIKDDTLYYWDGNTQYDRPSGNTVLAIPYDKTYYVGTSTSNRFRVGAQEITLGNPYWNTLQTTVTPNNRTLYVDASNGKSKSKTVYVTASKSGNTVTASIRDGSASGTEVAKASIDVAPNLQTLNPSAITSNGNYSYTPGSGYDGLSRVNVSVNVDIPRAKYSINSTSSNNTYNSSHVNLNYGDYVYTYDTGGWMIFSAPSKNTPNLQNRTVSISNNGTQVFTPESGYDGLNTLTVKVDIPRPKYGINTTSANNSYNYEYVNLNYGDYVYTYEPNGWMMFIAPSKNTPNLQNKSVSVTGPGTFTYTPDSGYDGLNTLTVTVNKQSGGGSADASNILVGTYSWYDSSASAYLPSGVVYMNDFGTLINQHKNGRGYAVFKATISGGTGQKWYAVPVG